MSRKFNCILRFRTLSKIMLQLSLSNGFQILQLRLVSFQIVEMTFILGVSLRISDTSILYTDLDETLRMYTSSYFRVPFSTWNRKWTSLSKSRKFQSSKPEVKTYLIGKLVGFRDQSHIFVIFISQS